MQAHLVSVSYIRISFIVWCKMGGIALLSTEFIQNSKIRQLTKTKSMKKRINQVISLMYEYCKQMTLTLQ